MERSLAILVADFEFGTALKQGANALGIAHSSCRMKGRPPVLVSRIHIGAGVDEDRDVLWRALFLSGRMEGSPALGIQIEDVSAPEKESPDLCRPAVFRGVMQRGQAEIIALLEALAGVEATCYFGKTRSLKEIR